MKRFAIALVAVTGLSVALGQIASAADLPVKAPGYKAPLVAQPYDWSGFYVGVNAGGHWAKDDDPAYVSFNNDFGALNIPPLNQAAPVQLNPSGFAGGVHVGYNWQISNLLFGLEADIDGLTGTQSRNLIVPLIGGSGQFMDSASDRFMSTLRARLGWTADRFLIFVSGGVALSEWTLNHTFNNANNTVFGTNNQTVMRAGGTVGGGVEYAIDANWLVRAEYIYANFGTTTSVLNAPSIVPPFTTAFTEPEKLSENIVRIGVSYKFGSR